MATSQKKPCSKCDKGGGIFTCDGCQQSFCRRHSDEHRQELATQMDSIGQEHDVLQREINKEVDVHPILSRIDVWERESINKIQQVAKEARDDLNQLINQTKQEFKTTMNKLTNELQASSESEDYTEIDLKKWNNQLNELREELEQSINTYLLDDNDQQSTIRLIRMRASRQLHSSPQPIRASEQSLQNNQNLVLATQERFGNANEVITLTENGLVVVHKGPPLGRSGFAFGSNHYSFGTHRIRFRIEKKAEEENFFIGTVISSQMDPASVMQSSSISGWWLNTYTVVNGRYGELLDKADIVQGDEVTLTLDCDQKRIHYEHHRTKVTFLLPINIKKCPLPWKIVIGLSTRGDAVRIIH